MDRRSLMAAGLAGAVTAMARPALAQGMELEGTWDAEVMRPQGPQPFIYHVRKSADGVVRLVGQNPFQTASVPGAVEQRNGAAVLTLPGGTSMTVRPSDEGSTLEGEYASSGLKAPMVMRRREAGGTAPAPARMGGLAIESFNVPEDRERPGSRPIPLRFARIRTSRAQAGSPIVFLAGGPGGSGIAAGLRPTSALLRRMAEETGSDIVLLDQRGTGLSDHIPLAPLPTPQRGPPRFTRQAMIDAYRAEVPRQWAFWESQGVVMSGYTTAQSAHDVEDLRRHLGVAKIKLWGSSYGVHLAQTVLRYHGETVERVCLTSAAGGDRIATGDAVIARIAAKIAADPQAAAAYPDLPGLMRRVHQRYATEPGRLRTPLGEARFDAFAIQFAASQPLLGSREAIAMLPQFYRELDRGQTGMMMQVAGPYVAAGIGADLKPMAVAMHGASRPLPDELAAYRAAAEDAILGDAAYYPYLFLFDLIPNSLPELRRPFTSDVPALIVGGELEGTPASEAAAEFGRTHLNSSFIEVANEAHDAGGGDPRVQALMIRFLKGEDVPSQQVALPPIRFRT